MRKDLLLKLADVIVEEAKFIKFNMNHWGYNRGRQMMGRVFHVIVFLAVAYLVTAFIKFDITWGAEIATWTNEQRAGLIGGVGLASFIIAACHYAIYGD